MTRLKGSGSLIIGGGSLTLGAGSAERGAGSQTWGAGSKLSYVRKIVNPCVNIRTVWAVVRHKFFVNMAHKKFEWDYLAVLFYDRLDTDVTGQRMCMAPGPGTDYQRPSDHQNCRYLHSSASSRPTRLFEHRQCWLQLWVSCTVVRRCCDCTASSAPTTNVPTRLDLTPLDLPFA